jgi:hypothetical protein
MNLLYRITRRLSAWAWRDEINICNGIAEIEELHATQNGMDIAIKQSPACAQYVAQCFASIVAASPNYTEMKFEVVLKTEKWEWITVLVKKDKGKTPHELRLEAERERDQLREEVKRLKQKDIENSWRESPDRSGGQFTQDELNDRYE